MRSDFSRREFIAGLGVLAAAKSNLSATPFPSSSSSETPRLGKSPFKIAVINDEISQDFGHACEVASQQFGMEWMELRSMWNKNVADSRCQRNRRGATPPEEEQPARHRHRQPALQSRLGRARRNRSSARNTISSTRTLPTTSRVKFSIAPSNWPRSSPPIASAASTSGGSTIRPPIARP